jgi:hypothetical protein
MPVFDRHPKYATANHNQLVVAVEGFVTHLYLFLFACHSVNDKKNHFYYLVFLFPCANNSMLSIDIAFPTARRLLCQIKLSFNLLIHHLSNFIVCNTSAETYRVHGDSRVPLPSHIVVIT